MRIFATLPCIGCSIIPMFSKGILYILIATLSFAVMNVTAKDISNLPALQVVFFRAFGSFVFIFPYMLYKRISIVGHQPKFLLLRGIVGVISLVTFFLAIQRIPLGSAISIRYLGPIFGAGLAAYFLKEKISKGQWISFAIAFSGVIILKGFDLRIDFISLGLAITSAVFVGMVFVLIRFLGAREHYLTIINYFMVICMLVGICSFPWWQMPVGREWFSVISIGIFGLIGQVFMTRAFQLEETSVLAPFKYMELIYALILGYFIFDESYQPLAFAGIILILAGMLLNVVLKNKKSDNT